MFQFVHIQSYSTRCDVARSATCRANCLPLSGRERLHTESGYTQKERKEYYIYITQSIAKSMQSGHSQTRFCKNIDICLHLLVRSAWCFFAGGSMPTNGPMLGGAGGLPTDTAIGRPKQLRSRGCLMVSEFIVPLIHFPLFIPKMMLQPKSGHSVPSPTLQKPNLVVFALGKQACFRGSVEGGKVKDVFLSFFLSDS